MHTHLQNLHNYVIFFIEINAFYFFISKNINIKSLSSKSIKNSYSNNNIDIVCHISK